MLAELTAIACLIATTTVIWSNPKRKANWAFTFMSCLVLAWLFITYLGAASKDIQLLSLPFGWYRINAAVAAFFPWAISLIRIQLSDNTSFYKAVIKTFPLLLFAAIGSTLSFHDLFIYNENYSRLRIRGIPYLLQFFISSYIYVATILSAQREQSQRHGTDRIEITFVAYYLGISFLGSICCLAFGNIIPSQEIRRLAFVFAILGYALVAWGVTHGCPVMSS
jgi:hypothetical protein